MEIFISGMLLSIFWFLNFKIISSDIKEKKIPNKYLLFLLILLPFWYLVSFIFWYFWEIHIGIYLLQFFLALCVCFALYHFWLWWAWDVKYIFVLSLFLLDTSIISLLWAIWLVTLLYLFWYFLLFWVQRIFPGKNNIFLQLWESQKQKLIHEKKNNTLSKYYKKLVFWCIIFLIVFLLERLNRSYILEKIYKTFDFTPSELLLWILNINNGIIIIFFVWFLMLALSFIFLKYALLQFQEKLGYNLQFLFILLLFGLLIFLSYDDIQNNTQVFLSKAFLILTVYLAIYFSLRILWASYKVAFRSQEEVFIKIEDLRAGMIIDKSDFLRNYWNQSVIPQLFESDKKAKKLLMEIKNPLSQEDVEKIFYIYTWVDNYHIQQKTEKYKRRDIIKIVKTFALSPYILWGFILIILDIPNYLSSHIISFVSNL